jgi:hypothetical protein
MALSVDMFTDKSEVTLEAALTAKQPIIAATAKIIVRMFIFNVLFQKYLSGDF